MNRATLVPILLGALVFAGCASPGPGPTAPPSSSNRVAAPTAAGADHNDADVMFLQMMIPHHGQAVEIARLAKTKATRKEIRELAAAVEATQVSEAESMTAWLRAWGKPTEADSDPNAHAHHGGMPATSKDVIDALAKGGPSFDRDAVNVLTGHQHGAVEMARTELKDGRNPQAKQLADRIVQSRTAQIQQLLTLLGQS